MPYYVLFIIWLHPNTAKMKLITLLSSLIVVHAGVVPEKCDGVVISGVYHDRELLHQDIEKPYLLAVDYSTDNLYFSYTKSLALQSEDSMFQSARVNLNTKEFKDIEGINDGFAQTVDQKTHEIYIGGSDGVYKYDYSTNKGQHIGAKNVNIWTLFYKDVLYYTTYPSEFLYTIVDGESVRFVDLEDTKVDNFVIDNDGVMFFNNDTGLYSQKKGTKDAIKFQNVSNVGVTAMTTDKNGNVYICLKDGVYKVKKDVPTIEKVLSIDQGYGVAFDSDNNMIYADVSKLIRLKPNTSKSC